MMFCAVKRWTLFAALRAFLLRKASWTSLYSKLGCMVLVWYTARKKVWLTSSTTSSRYAICVSYWVVLLSYLWWSWAPCCASVWRPISYPGYVASLLAHLRPHGVPHASFPSLYTPPSSLLRVPGFPVPYWSWRLSPSFSRPTRRSAGSSWISSLLQPQRGLEDPSSDVVPGIAASFSHVG
jgi:hypothetical protein